METQESRMLSRVLCNNVISLGDQPNLVEYTIAKRSSSHHEHKYKKAIQIIRQKLARVWANHHFQTND